MLPVFDDDAFELAGLRPKREWRARGDGEFLDGVIGEPLSGVPLVADLSLADRVSAVFSAEALGVRGVPEDAEDDGR